MNKLIALFSLASLSVFGQAITTRNLDSKDFNLNTNVQPWDVTVQTNKFPPFNAFDTNYFTSNNFHVTINTNTQYWVTNASEANSISNRYFGSVYVRGGTLHVFADIPSDNAVEIDQGLLSDIFWGRSSLLYSDGSVSAQTFTNQVGFLTNGATGFNDGKLGWAPFNVIVTNSNSGITNIINFVATNTDFWNTNAAIAGSISNKYLGPVTINGNTLGLNLDQPFYLGTYQAGQAGIYNFAGQLGIAGGASFGTIFVGPSRDQELTIGDISNGEKWLRGSWHVGANQIPGASRNEFGGGTYRNADAALDSYLLSPGGSAGAMADLPMDQGVIADNQPKPMILLDTRSGNSSDANNLVSCNLSSVTNGVNAWNTNGLTAFFTNNNIRMGFVLEDGFLTNHRDTVTGLLRWNTNRFPWLAGGDTMATNVSTYLSTNGFEPMLMFYQDSHESSVANWANGISEWDLNPVTAVTGWEYPNGSNPLGAVEIQPATTPSQYHKDVSGAYMWGFRGLIFQDVSGAVGNGAFQQAINSLNYAAINPYFNPGQSTEIKKDAQWNEWYPSGNYPGGVSQHGMIMGYLAGSANKVWPQKYAHMMNQLWVESLQTTTEPAGSGPLGWLMGQIKNNINFFTNSTGPCLPVFSGDGFNPAIATYQQWQDLMCGYTLMNANPWFNKDYSYVNTAGFGSLLTNKYLVPLWQTVTKPIVAISITSSNAILMRSLPYERLVWFVNEGNSATNLTVNWSQVGLVSNATYAVTEAVTNNVFSNAVNSITLTIPAVSSLLIRLQGLAVPGVLSEGTNSVDVLVTNIVSSFINANTNQILMATPNTNTAGNSIMDQSGFHTIDLIAGNTNSSVNFNLYGFYTNSTHYDRLSTFWDGSAYNIQESRQGMAGSTPGLVLGVGGVQELELTTSTFFPLSDNTLSLGANSQAFNNIWFGGTLVQEGAGSTSLLALGRLNGQGLYLDGGNIIGFCNNNTPVHTELIRFNMGSPAVADFVTIVEGGTALGTTNWQFDTHGTLQLATNALVNWPVQAGTPGGLAFVNSNSTLYVLISAPNSTAWTSTNRLAGP